MKRTDSLIKITSLLVFIALAAYLSVYIARRATDPVQTSLTVTATMSDSAPMSGLVIRDELLINSRELYIDVTAADGAKVAAGGTVAVAYSSEEALDRASRLSALDREIDEVTAALSSNGASTATGNRERSIYSAITALSASLRGTDLTEVDSRSSALAGLLFPTETGATATEGYLQQLEDERDQLRHTSAGDTQSITVSQSGTFSSLVDGYEGVSPDYVHDMTPSELRELIAADRVVDGSSLGKLITSYDWYYAAILPREYARQMLAGSRVQLSFGRYYSGLLNAEVEWVGRAEGDDQLVLFRLEKGMADMLAVRSVAAELIYEEYTGLRVPLKGLYRYYAAYVSDLEGQALQEGQAVTLTLGDREYQAFVSEVGDASRYGDLPAGVEAGSEEDTRPRRRLAVFCWPWDDTGPADSSSGVCTITAPELPAPIYGTNYYDYRTVAPGAEGLEDDDEDKWIVPDRLCVFTMTGMQAERKIVQLIYAGEEYCLLSSEGNDALREGNEVIVQARDLYNGRVFS